MVKLSPIWINRLKKGSLIASICLIAVGLISSLIFNVFLSPCTKQQFSIMTDSEFPIFGTQFEIDCNLYEPKSQYDFYGSQRPALVLVHGFMSSKVYFQGLAYELTKRGFVCLTISANGHSASGGAFTPTWENATLSAVKYLHESSTILKIDINRIGLIGHSMGSFSVSVASILDQELGNYWINATVGIGGPFLNITRGFGPGFAYFLGNPVIYPNLWYDPETAMTNVIIEGRTNLTRPYNYMNIIGDHDEAFSQNSAYEVVYGMSSPAFWAAQGVADQSQIVPSTTYGIFNGSARRLVVIPGLGHAAEGQHRTTAIEIIDWFEESMKLKAESNYPGSLNPNTIMIEWTSMSGMLAAFGGLLLLLPLVAYLGNWLKPEIAIPKNAMKMEKRDKWRMFLIYGIVFVGIAFSVSPLINGLNLLELIPTDFLASNLLTLPLLIQGLLLIPMIFILMWYERRRYGLDWTDFGFSKEWRSYLRAALYGFLLFIIPYIILNLASSSVMHNLVIWRIVGFFETFLYVFIAMLVFEILFRGLIQNKLYEFQTDTGFIPTRWKEIIKAAIITGTIEGLALGIITTMLLASGGFDVFSTNMGGMIPQNMGITLSWIPPM
ncbi:MAG: alpha/beta hydrolase family protein, partial [Candidatus Helarchaeota archaeon]